MHDLFEEADVIFTYTAEMAVRDGELVDCRQSARWTYLNDRTSELVTQHFGPHLPVYLSRGLANTIEKAVDNKRSHNDPAGVLHDIFSMAFFGRFFHWQGRQEPTAPSWHRSFTVKITGIGRRSLVQLLAVVDGDGLFFLYPHER